MKRLDKEPALPQIEEDGETTTAEKYETEKHFLINVYRRIICLQYTRRCGLCGTSKHENKPYWNLGMRLCKYCLQDNLVSHLVLEDRYWIHVWARPHGFSANDSSFVRKVIGKVWFFKEISTPRQRTEYTCDPTDFLAVYGTKSRTTWFFWRPHLEKLMDLPKLEEEAVIKRQAAALIRGYARRSATLRILCASGGCVSAATRKRPLRQVDWHSERDLRPALFKVRRFHTATEWPVRGLPKVDNLALHKMNQFEDRLYTSEYLRPKEPAT